VKVLINDYNKACTEVIEILKLLPKSEYEKIPSKEIEYYIENSDKEYNFKLDLNKPIFEQEISRTAYAILVSIYRSFFLNAEKKKVLEEILCLNKMLKKNNK
jgi:hypothetical protein